MKMENRSSRAHAASSKPRAAALLLPLLAATVITASAAHAQAVPGAIDIFPDAGALQRSQEMQRGYLEERVPAPETPEPVIRDEQSKPPAASSRATASFELKRLDFDPSSYLSDQDLDAIRARYVGQPINYDGLQIIVQEINALYRKRGILTARAILPPQKVVGGAVRIELVEGRLGKVSVVDNRNVRDSWLVNWLEIEPGEPLDTAKLERRIELFNHSNDMRLDARLRPGASFGYTDLMLQAHQLPPYQLRVFAGNEGSRSVGRNQVGLDGAWNSPIGIGDRLGLYYLHSDGSDSASINYTIPVNRQGGRLGVSYSDLDSRVVSGPYEDFDVKGRARSGQIVFRQPLLQKGAWWFDGTLAGGVSKSTNDILGARLSEEKVKSATVGLFASGLYEDRSLSLSVTNSNNRMESSLSGHRSANIWAFNGSWIEKVSGAQYTLLRASAQQTSAKILSPSLLLQLGGATTVRGYPVGVVAGDNGYFANLEWHHRIRGDVSGFVFGDTGTVRTAGTPNQQISSLGVGLDARLLKSVDFNITVGRAANIVVPDQGRYVITARVAWQIF
ncbi:ShlB/FhaC/HecB family hemolysin secretion/activation protein [Pollutimonas bauzanensis]|uniref:Hemolysin activation/secretion protein n=1 Tax=Pollutimonas bauzanensis TaxID=658167 RepID=A0A1M5Q1G9_9BURK|nr:ShlB/FhaC/HecB family hemolysin secretion/activation protein [Pollutimonas bauzanensis]SHH07313.1 Hemolysin activation/secretion protein [Pollutimonas bauzanensis]